MLERKRRAAERGQRHARGSQSSMRWDVRPDARAIKPACTSVPRSLCSHLVVDQELGSWARRSSLWPTRRSGTSTAGRARDGRDPPAAMHLATYPRCACVRASVGASFLLPPPKRWLSPLPTDMTPRARVDDATARLPARSLKESCGARVRTRGFSVGRRKPLQKLDVGVVYGLFAMAPGVPKYCARSRVM